MFSGVDMLKLGAEKGEISNGIGKRKALGTRAEELVGPGYVEIHS